MFMSLRLLRIGFVGVLALLLAIQLIPYRPTANPAVVAEPPWDSPQTRALAQRACFDCHSNATVWPAYSYVAPVSWLIVHDTLDGRERLNFSEWGVPRQARGGREREDPGEEAGKEIRRGSMPPRMYLLLHPSARLSDAEKQQLIDGLAASLRQ
jgi:cytochrome c551/c552